MDPGICIIFALAAFLLWLLLEDRRLVKQKREVRRERLARLSRPPPPTPPEDLDEF